ncbi:MAG: cytochrome b/b6 domain-containing protein [Bryobacteraceae bacterium]
MFRTILGFLLWAGITGAYGQGKTDCGACHDQAAKIATTPHNPLGCASCHPEITAYPHPKNTRKPACPECHASIAREERLGVHGQERAKGNQGAPDCGVCHGDVHEVQVPASVSFRKSVPDTCGMCHTEIAEQYKASIHGQAVARGIGSAPICTDCHGEHSILRRSQPNSPVSAGHIRETCGRCHGDLRLTRRFGLPSDRLVSFDASFHGLAGKAGSQSIANCASCHGYHDILPSSDPKSRVSQKRLPETCGKCHPGAGKRFAIGTVHLVEGRKEPAGVRFVREAYLILIPFVIGLMALHNLGDWVRKLYQSRLRLRGPLAFLHPPSESKPGPVLAELRMYRFERIEHVLLLISFTVLAWTGFALKYPDQWWAKPLTMWEVTYPVRATVHRVAAVIMMTVGFIHLLSLCVNRRLRRHWYELWPRASDVREGFLKLAWLLGLRSKKPFVSPHGYVEKAEYWAVAWGTVVMAITGIALWAVDHSLGWMPKEWLDVATSIHFYEAILATLAIVIWHFYFVIFDPEVYPLDTAWLTGFSPRKRAHPEPPPTPEGDSETHDSPQDR